jgi:hypothetical protein
MIASEKHDWSRLNKLQGCEDAVVSGWHDQRLAKTESRPTPVTKPEQYIIITGSLGWGTA